MADLSFYGWRQFDGGIDDTNLKPGGQYFSLGLDTIRKPSYLTVADSLQRSVSENTVGAFTETIYWMDSISGNIFALDSGGDLWIRTSGGTWTSDATWPHADGNTGVGQSLIEFNDEIFWTANTTVGRVQTPTGVPTFTDSWQTGLTSSSWHPMEKLVGKLIIGHGRNIATWDGVTWTLAAMVLPRGFVCKSMAVIGDFVAIGTIAPSGEDSRIFFWDGISDVYNKEIKVKAASVDALMTWSNTLWVVAGNAANLHFFDGSNLQETAKIADVDVDAGETVVVRPGGLAHHQGRILIAVNTVSNTKDRVFPGIWSFSPATGAFVFEHPVHTRGLNESAHAYSVFSDGTNFWVGGSDSNTGADDAHFVDQSGGARYTETAYYITQWFDTVPFADKHFRKAYLNFREFASTGNNEITMKYRLDDTLRRLNAGAVYTATAGAAGTVTVADASALLIGDEITVVAGPASGDIRRITNIAANVLTVDRNFSDTPVNAQTKFYAERWTELDTVNTTEDGDKTLKDFWLSSKKGKKIQFKIEMRDAGTTGEEVAISEINLSYIQKRPT